MADFKAAYENLTRPAEGWWARVEDDPGGDTYGGLTRRDYGYVTEIWEFLDKQTYIYNKHFPELDPILEKVYLTDIWNKQIFGDQIEDQSLANMIFDMSVNKGHTYAIEFAQKAAGIPITGVMDQNVINGLNNPNI